MFVDETHSAMKAGRFLILIAGDGIREDVSGITELINRNAASGFTFGLIEAALYGFDDGGLVIQPRVIAKTKLIERSIVVIRDSESTQFNIQDVSGETVPRVDDSGVERNEFGESPKQVEYRKWWTPVLAMKFDDPEQDAPVLYYPNNVRIPLPWPKMWLSIYNIKNGRVGVCTAGQKEADQSALEQLDPQRDEIVAELPHGSEYTRFDNSDGFTYRTDRNADDFNDEEELKDWLIVTANQYVNSFRSRLKAIIQSS